MEWKHEFFLFLCLPKCQKTIRNQVCIARNSNSKWQLSYQCVIMKLATYKHVDGLTRSCSALLPLNWCSVMTVVDLKSKTDCSRPYFTLTTTIPNPCGNLTSSLPNKELKGVIELSPTCDLVSYLKAIAPLVAELIMEHTSYANTIFWTDAAFPKLSEHNMKSSLRGNENLHCGTTCCCKALFYCAAKLVLDMLFKYFNLKIPLLGHFSAR